MAGPVAQHGNSHLSSLADGGLRHRQYGKHQIETRTDPYLIVSSPVLQ
jgi:hypothetical protein